MTTIPTSPEHNKEPIVVHSLQSKITLYFGVLLTVVLVVVNVIRIYGLPLTLFQGEYAQRQQEIFHNLSLIADLKKAYLLNWLEERRRDIEVLTESELFRNALASSRPLLNSTGQLSESALWQTLKQDENHRILLQQLHSLKETHPIYETIQLIDIPSKQVIASTNPTDLGLHLSVDDLPILQPENGFIIYQTPFKLSFVRSFYLEMQDHINQQFLIIAAIDNRQLTNTLMNSNPFLGETTEILLITETLHTLSNSPPTETFALTSGLKKKLLEFIMQEHTEVLLTKGVNGREILIAYRPLPSTLTKKWGLIVKVSADEIFTPLHKESLYPLLIGSFLGLVFGMGLTFFLARRLTYPIQVLCQTIKEIEEGNMDARAVVTTQDEVRLLAHLFNEMVSQLHHTQQKMEWLIEENAAELRTSNFSLLMTVDEMQDLNDDLAQEISVRKQVEAQLRKERLQQQIIFDSVPAFIWQKDTENNVVWMNKPAAKFSGMGDGSTECYPWADLFPAQAESSHQEDLKIVQSGRPLLGIVEQFIMDDKTVWLKTDKVPYIDEDGNLVGIVVLSMDITAKLEAEYALQESEQRFRTIVDTAVDGIIMIDVEGTIQLFNPSFANMFDYSLAELQGQNIRHLMTSEYAEKYAHYLQIYRETGDDSIVGVGREIVGRRRDGSTFPIHLAIGELDLKNQRMFTGIVSDITALKHAQQALQKSKEALEIQNKAYSRFVPREFLSFLGKDNIVEVELGDQVQREMTIMFADIRSFTELSEKLTPEENFRFINSYLSKMEPVVQANHGFIDKYIGDSIMALFPDNADDAVCGAVAMLHTLEEFNSGRRRAGYSPIEIGIGLHTGSLMLGTIGGKNRMDGTVISDAVNLASRVESLTKMYGASLLITEHTYNQLTHVDNYVIRIIDKVKVKGKSQPVIVFEVIDGNLPHVRHAKLATLELFIDAFIAYQAHHFELAEHYFRACLERNPHDRAVHIYIKRCQHWQKYGDDQGWNGVMELESKDGLSRPDIVSPYFEV